jgi:N-acetylglutamate synthase-like GNAT family acetyltransferase
MCYKIVKEVDVIRQFRVEDATACRDLIHSCLDADPSLSASLRKKIRDGESPQTMEERARLFYLAVYEEESELLGLAGLDLNEIRLMCVSPKRWRTGIGRALFNHLSSMVPGSFFTEIFVYSSIPATEFYKTQGFIEKGSAPFHIGEESMRTVFMTCRLRPSSS